jgi:PTH1 family peptidyl-tRNA hydrolase
VGVGAKPRENWDLADWVLSKFNKSELETINESMGDIYESVCLIINEKTDEAMNKFN